MIWTIPIDERGTVNLLGSEGTIEIEIIAERRMETDRLILSGVHFTKNAGERLRPKQLIEFGRDFLRQYGAGRTTLTVIPAMRTTGANPGHTPHSFTIQLETS